MNGPFSKAFSGCKASPLGLHLAVYTSLWETVATCSAAGVLLTVRSRVGPSTVYASPALGQPPGSSGRRLRGQGLLMQGGSTRSQPASVRWVGKQAGVVPGVGAPVGALRGALPASLGPSSRCVWHS